MLERLYLSTYDPGAGLAEFPELGARIPLKTLPGASSGNRRIVVNPYLVFYRVLDEQITIARVLQGRQNWLHSLFGPDVEQG